MSDRLTPETCSFVLMGRSSVTVVQTCQIWVKTPHQAAARALYEHQED